MKNVDLLVIIVLLEIEILFLIRFGGLVYGFGRCVGSRVFMFFLLFFVGILFGKVVFWYFRVV